MTQNGFWHQHSLINLKKIKNRIKKNEGYINTPYYDQLGYRTIGYGHLIKKNEDFLEKKKYSEKYLGEIFENDFNKTIYDFKKNYANKGFKKNVQEVLIEMIFQLGINKTTKFKKFNKYLIEKKPHLAAMEMLNSLWYLQTPKRVELLINILLNHKNDKRKK
ncbi:MAG: hypothetical protein CFH18_00041 [Alphaproteobacteria bacterium MarineAlpha5_Bin8]|nr:MAG: hypothetical protein CFH17_00902 [Alphaproteobacteria bacterium MarineAlpha5_Bin7]PPR48354.1 MAG: hypothetical protein CFH18_00041 [Alphaproteobacteria bacterium MarineAlpha5_Bin8]PPR54746.1 MAG: hypothetical protein CFH16_00195 [Alphaproteobacteria bacterium MarineAlpha5_Bin6]|tara:strand:+ start:1861 stop:2346 length:486 start_codon:yes stop_codon:yes gene_type:complete